MSQDASLLSTTTTETTLTGMTSASSSFMEVFKEKLNEVKRIIEEDKYRRRVLLLCQQSEPKSFDDYSSSGSFRKLEKFESSTYSEVLKAVDLANNNKPVVMKIMRALSKGVIRKLPSVATRGCQAYSDILNELVVTQALSQLHNGVLLNGRPKCLYKTHFFCLIQEMKVVSGNLERAVRKSQNTRQQEMLGEERRAVAAKLSSLAVATTKSAGPSGTEEPKLEESGKQQASELDTMLEPQAAAPPDEASRKAERARDEELKSLSEDERMLMEALPHEYVVTVMRHDGQPLWWWMTHRKLGPEQLASVLVQVIVGLAIAEKVFLYEHRDLHVSNILIKKTSKPTIPFVLEGNKFNIVSNGIKATIIDATFSRLTHNGKVYYRELTSTLRAYGTKKTPSKMSLQNRSYREMVQITSNNWDEFTPKTNLVWLTYLCETLMKSEILRASASLFNEVKKIRDYTLRVNNTLDLLSYFPFDRERRDKDSGNGKNGSKEPNRKQRGSEKDSPSSAAGNLRESIKAATSVTLTTNTTCNGNETTANNHG